MHRFLEGLGIKCLPYAEARAQKERPRNVIYGGRYVARLLAKDPQQVETVLRCIQEAGKDGPRCFDDVVIWAVWNVVEAHYGGMPRKQALMAFQGIDLAKIRRRAKTLCVGEYGRMSTAWPVIAGLIADQLLEREAE